MKKLYKILTTEISFHFTMASGHWYEYLIPKNIAGHWHDFKLIRWTFFIWRWDK